MAGKVTLQDIADALGVSRNTVSKAINNTGVLADATREKVLQKVAEMGYKQFSYRNQTVPGDLLQSVPMGEIALFTTGFAEQSAFLSAMLDRIQRGFSQKGYHFTIYRIQDDEIESLLLPGAFVREWACGIVCVQVFDGRYCSMLCDMNIPVLFVDSPVIALNGPLRADVLHMDNQSDIFRFVREMAGRDKKRIGFIGEYMRCQSFFERYMGYRNAMQLMGLPIQEQYCITGNKEGGKDPGAGDYREYLEECFRKLDEPPDVFLCANDFVAFDTLYACKKMGIAVPRDLWLCGFGDALCSLLITPSLTTVHIHGHSMGDSAVHLLSSRIQEPSLHFRTIHTQTSLIYRESTGD